MGKQQKSKNTERKKRASGRKPQGELLKKPTGMCKVIFKELAWLFAYEIKLKNSRKD